MKKFLFFCLISLLLTSCVEIKGLQEGHRTQNSHFGNHSHSRNQIGVGEYRDGAWRKIRRNKRPDCIDAW